ncbi:DUF6677 family protein [Maioricimonas sp. JC845]|uniref:DUF6677 family protein n=1 Tax=Maioricimonas sp. JC845 TaxID=3232138 RepID=UPI003458AE75
MSDPRIPLKEPKLAALLAFLLPGAGHLYQGRYFKAGLYAVCIWGLFLYGMSLADWKIVNAPPLHGNASRRGVMLKYAAQFGVGAPALVALMQSERYYKESNRPVRQLDAPLDAPFTGELTLRTRQTAGDVTGTVYLEPAQGGFGAEVIRGRFAGTDADGEPVEVQLGEFVELGRPISADSKRYLQAEVIDDAGGRIQSLGHLHGSIPRPFWNWFVVPLDDQQDRELHRQLGKYHELATVFTMIAGLLNVLAIWDALEGPAYGYGDEPESTDETPDTEAEQANTEKDSSDQKPVAEAVS